MGKTTSWTLGLLRILEDFGTMCGNLDNWDFSYLWFWVSYLKWGGM
jgi:hypothetical protein